MICEAAKSETYGDVEKLLFRLCHKIVCCDQCRFEDRMSTAREAFMRAYNSYDSTKGAQFSTWVYWQVRTALLTRKNQCIKQSERFRNGLSKLPNRSRKPGFMDLLWELSDDARDVVRIISEAPEEVTELWVNNVDAQGMVRSYLRGAGWTATRITRSFSEIRKALG